MAVTRSEIEAQLDQIQLPDGGSLMSRDWVRALSVEGGEVRFVIEAPSPEIARQIEGVRAAAERAVAALAGVTRVSVALTAHASSPKAPPQPPQGEPPRLKIGGHPKPQEGSMKPASVKSILAVAFARAGKKVGLLDADIYGPSQPRMMGVSKRPASPDGKTIEPLHAHGVTLMSIGLMLDPAKAVVWRGPMLMGALQQMISQVSWGELDVLIVDLPPGTGDVQLTLCQKAEPSGAIIVSTPQDVALLDARKAMDMFSTLKTPILGMIENMSTYICPECGHEAQIFGHGGVKAEAEKMDLPFLGSLPIDLDTRLAGDAGTPIALGDGPAAAAYAAIAKLLIDGGIV